MMIGWGWASWGETFQRFLPHTPSSNAPAPPLGRSPESGLSPNRPPNSDSFSSPSLPYRQLPYIAASPVTRCISPAGPARL